MSTTGLGVMLRHLAGWRQEDVDLMKSVIGRTITAAVMTEEGLTLSFDNGKSVYLWDDGQSCCENRYVTSDDSTEVLIGRTFLDIEEKAGPEEEGEWGDTHEQMFVEIKTDRGTSYTMVTHNEHNGYYGGFALNWRQA